MLIYREPSHFPRVDLLDNRHLCIQSEFAVALWISSVSRPHRPRFIDPRFLGGFFREFQADSQLDLPGHRHFGSLLLLVRFQLDKCSGLVHISRGSSFENARFYYGESR